MDSKRKTVVLLLILIFLTSLVLFTHATVKAQTRTFIVPDDYSDIQTAINHANNGDTVFVRAGTYIYDKQNTTLCTSSPLKLNYGIMVNKSISLIGENKNTIISTNYGFQVRAVIISTDGVTFTGFTVTSNLSSHYGMLYDAIYSVEIGGSNCTITNNDFHRRVSAYGNNENISYNNFEGADNFGIVATKLNNSIISHNCISNNTFGGITISNSANVTIENNNINGNGVDYYDGSYLLDYYGDGISVTTDNQNLNLNISIYNNNITSNARFGIQFNGATSNSSIFNNNITNNGVGINLSNLGFRGYSPFGNGTEIFYNNIVGNGKNAYVDATNVVSWDNGVVGNYWSDYNDNGSYVIDENNIDHHPLTQQVDVNSVAPTPTPSATISSFNALAIAIITIVIIFALAISLLLFRRHRKNRLIES